MINTKAIREVAAVTSDSERMQFKPSTVIALLDRLEAAEAEVKELQNGMFNIVNQSTDLCIRDFASSYLKEQKMTDTEKNEVSSFCTVTRLMALADDYADAPEKPTRQALEAELVRLFTPLSDVQKPRKGDWLDTTRPKYDIGGES